MMPHGQLLKRFSPRGPPVNNTSLTIYRCPRLLRFLQHGEIRPVGSTQTTLIDVRLVSATRRDLDTEVSSATGERDKGTGGAVDEALEADVVREIAAALLVRGPIGPAQPHSNRASELTVWFAGVGPRRRCP